MRFDGTGSWRVELRSDRLLNCALWIRAAERLAVPADPLVPGELDLAHPPAPISTADDQIARQWLGWWHSILMPNQHAPLPDPVPEPAYGTPDPLGLAPYPELAAIVARRAEQARQWESHREPTRHHGRSMLINDTVRAVERAQGRPATAFSVEFILVPVRDDVVRRVDPVAERYLVPERVYQGPAWRGWVRQLVTRLA